MAREASADQLITRIVLNQEEKGDFFVNRTSRGDFLVKSEDLRKMGFRAPVGTLTMIDGEAYLSLQSMNGVGFSFDESSLSLALTAVPSLLASTSIDFAAPQNPHVYYPNDSSAFLNYGIDYTAASGLSFSSLKLSEELGARSGNFVFLSDSAYTKTEFDDRFVRLQTNITYDQRDGLRRYVAGDFFASSGALGSSLNMGGLSLAKVYRINPYFINYPTIGLTGQVALPSDATVYLNGMQMRSEKISPGEFSLLNITPYGGAGLLDVVLRDPFGREQHLSYPFYSADSYLLKKGLHEYSYNVGFLRDDYGVESNKYSKAVFSAFHHYGVSDSLTLGARSEASGEIFNLGMEGNVLLGYAGVVSVGVAGSAGKGANEGAAGSAAYVYQGRRFGARCSLMGFTRNYGVIATASSDTRTNYQASAGVSYADRSMGSMSFDYTTIRRYSGVDSAIASVGYSRNLTNEFTINATYRLVRQDGYDNRFLISFSYIPKANLFVSASEEAGKDGDSTMVQVQKNPPAGEGLGYRGMVSRSSAGDGSSYSVSPSVQYNGRYGTYLAEINAQNYAGHSSEQYHLSAAGSLVYVSRIFGATRPVYDSFGLVKVGDVKDVKILLNSQEVGTTDSAGRLFIPNLGSYYQNQVAISDKGIPLDYHLSNVMRLVSPPLRSGSCIAFPVVKLQPITGKLAVRVKGEVKPVQFQEITLTVKGTDMTLPTGKGGEFDIDVTQSDEFRKMAATEEGGCASTGGVDGIIRAGTYQGAFIYEGKRRTFNVTIPRSKDPIVDLGEIVVDLPEK